ncbi:MAG: phosphoribosylamine--glycine ligase [Halobacteria archaeon]
MRLLLAGGGAREHAIASVLKGHEICAVSSNRNPGVAKLAREHLRARETDVEAVAAFAAKHRVGGAIIGPEAPLAAGLADRLEAEGVPVLGPRREPARIEWDKGWARALLAKHKVPGQPGHRTVASGSELERLFRDLPWDPVVKPLGLTGGKGVRVMGDHFSTPAEALAYAREVLRKDGSVLLEEKLEGEEFTLMALADGRDLLAMPAVQDHKRAREGDRGPNTGGMGSYSDRDHSLPFLRTSDLERALSILRRTLDAIRVETGIPYRGVLYAGCMATADGVKILEFNSRFGDPEACNVLALLDGNLGDFFEGGKWRDLRFRHRATVCKYLVPEGYPERPLSGQPIALEPSTEALFFFANVDERDGALVTSSSRSVAVVGVGDTLEEAERKAEAGLGRVRGRLHARHDIGTPALVGKRVEHMTRLRAGRTRKLGSDDVESPGRRGF